MPCCRSLLRLLLHSPFSSLVCVAIFAGCSATGGQTGSELICASDDDCTSVLGPGFWCGPERLCVEGERPVDASLGDAGEALDAAVTDGGTARDGGRTDGGGASCRSNADCTVAGEECLGPSEGPVCGIGSMEECANDDGCAPGQVCHAVWDGCSLDVVGSQCGAPCTADSCWEGFRCGASGACEAILCDEGVTCQPFQACDAAGVRDVTTVYDRHHGCVAIPCGGDGDCATDQACVNGVCQEGIGRCVVPMPVP